MNNLFERTNAFWAKYSQYEYRRGDDDILYLVPMLDATPIVYDPMKDAEALVVDALNVGRLAMKRGSDKKLQQAILDFVTKYGLLGFMPALPTTTEFMNYDSVYLPKNHFIKDETILAKDYLKLFFPFQKPDVYKDRDTAIWHVNINDHYSPMVAALAITFDDEPISVGMSLLPIYAERYEWLATQFRDWAFMIVSSFLFYEDKGDVDDFSRDLYREGITAFGNRAPTYRIKLFEEKPKIVWDFHSLLLTIQTMFGFALTDEKKPLRICGHCNLVFAAGHPNAVFCSPKCKNQHNVYKSRGKKEQDAD